MGRRLYNMKKRILLLAATILCLLSCKQEARQRPRFLWIDASANFNSYANDADSIARDCKRIAAMGFTDIVVDVRPTSGDVLFKSTVAPELKAVPAWFGGEIGLKERTATFDYLEAFIEEGHAAGLKVHAAINTLVAGCAATIIPETTTSIGQYAFNQQTALTSVSIPMSVSSIGGSAFAGCTSLVDVYCYRIAPPSIGWRTFDAIKAHATLHVPFATTAKYLSAGWDFENIVEMEQSDEVVTTIIDKIKAENDFHALQRKNRRK